MKTGSLFVLGGTRSGKSRYAQARAEAQPGNRAFIATAQAFDQEMEERIARHQADRDANWQTLEAPIDLPQAISSLSGSGTIALVDCLTLWTSNLLLGGHDLQAARSDLCAAVKAFEGALILVSNEVGLGIVPDNALARSFRDEAGWMNQEIAKVADEVVFVAAGLPLWLRQI